MDNENSPALFRDQSQALIAQSDAAAVARATQEIQAALVIAQRNPRDEIRIEAKIMQACKKKSLAEVAEYEYSRGGTKIVGPTIDLLRAIANRWGNLLFGWSEVERKEGQSLVRCFAWDTENNSRAERSFVVRHWRDTQAGGYEISDERDIYELIANMASRRVRACLEEIIDADIVEKAIDQCRKTLKEGEKLPLKDRAAKMVTAFGELGVTPAMVEKRIGNALDAISENQLVSLRRVYKAIQDGVGKREDYFKPTAADPKFKDEAAEAEAGLAPGGVHPIPMAPPAPPAEPETPLKQLRTLMKADKITDAKVLAMLAEIGVTDGSVGSLEELQMMFPDAVPHLLKDWEVASGHLKQGPKK